MRILLPRLLCVALAFLAGPAGVSGDEPVSFDTLGVGYERDVRPLLQQYCLECHSEELQEGDLDLEHFAKFDEVRRDPESWQKVREMLDSGEMPPEDSQQPSADQFKLLRGWVRSYLDVEADARAGDPGPVVLRRLTNAEYTYTIRDLTGVNLNPAREFPSEGAAGEGFNNVGDALVISPGMLRKYLDAGEEIAGHAVLLPDGFRFSAHSTRRDWTDEILAQIRGFYGEFADTAETPFGRGGVLPLERYFAATLVERDALTSGGKTVAAVAEERGLNARYLGLLWSSLTADNRSLVLDGLRSRWQTANPQDAAELAAAVATWQNGLWVFNPVALLGRKGSRTRWLEAVNPLLTEQELRFSFPAPKEGEESKGEEAKGEEAKGEEKKEEPTEVVLSLVATDAGDGNEHDFVVWQQPRLVAEGQPDILLCDVAAASSRLLLRDATVEQSSDVLLFGRHPNGQAIDPDSLCVRAPSVIEIRLPAELVSGRELVTTAVLEQETGGQGSVQPEVVAGTPDPRSGLLPSVITVTLSDVNIGADTRTVSYTRPILVGENSTARERFKSSMEEYRSVFPAALCYTQLVPMDQILTLTLFYREDDHLARLILDDAQIARIDRLWQELRFVSRKPLKELDVLESLLETTINHPQEGIFDPLVTPFNEKADAFRSELIDSQTKHLDALVAFANRAYRRPLTDVEEGRLRDLHRRLCEQELTHDEAFRLTLVRVFLASPFLYRIENAPAGTAAAAVSDWELATRLSYFLWSSQPDDQLRSVADEGTLHTPEMLRSQAQRMLADARVRRLATEFACQWLHVHDFGSLARKSNKHFPEFDDLRGDMYEETILFLTDLFQHDRSLVSLLDADHTFVNQPLAEFYGIAGVEGGAWRRVEGIRGHGRGGILGLSTTLAQQSGATRTSPILRGNWVSAVLLGERLPRPPQNVPQLADAVPQGLSERQLFEQHSSEASCAKCHQRIDPFGFALESFDAIGRHRDNDLAGRAIDTKTKLPDGSEIEGLGGLRDYLLENRRDTFLRQFCRKLLGYTIGRETQLSDEPLLAEMMAQLAEKNYQFSAAIDTIVLSDQFRKKRGGGEND